MDIFKAYDIIKGKIEDDYLIENYKCIEHGLQFYIYHPHNKDLVRIYKNKKTGLTVDVSAVRDETVNNPHLISLRGFEEGACRKSIRTFLLW